MMFLFVPIFLTLCHYAISGHPHESKAEKPLFMPTFNHATLAHLNPFGYGSHSLENVALYPQYVYDRGSHDIMDPLQRQLPYQDTEKRLITFLNVGKAPKPHKTYEVNEDDYKRKANNILYDELNHELDDLDLKFKRSLTYTSYTPPTLSSNNYLEDRGAPSNSRAVPFGPYTTWLPYEGPLVTSYAPQNIKPTKGAKNRRRRDVTYEENNHLTLPQPAVIPPDNAIPVLIAYSPPTIRSVPVGPNAVFPMNTVFTGKLSTSFNTVPQNIDMAVPYNDI